MFTLRKAKERGHANYGWLDTHHSFSFADYHDPKHMGFSVLRVINEDTVKGGAGFPTHPHRDMEIITYILEGALEHKDSTGGTAVIRPGEVQRMTAGRGIQHSEYNPSKEKPTHLLQIWLLPEAKGLTPGYEQKDYTNELAKGDLVLVASREGVNGSLKIHQDVNLYAGRLKSGRTQNVILSGSTSGNPLVTSMGRRAWIQLATGSVRVGDIELSPGDGLAIEKTPEFKLEVLKDSELLIFDLP